jgi:hypothetical protein
MTQPDPLARLQAAAVAYGVVQEAWLDAPVDQLSLATRRLNGSGMSVLQAALAYAASLHPTEKTDE